MKNLKIALISVLVVLFSVPAFAADTKLAFVDLSRLFDEYYKTKDYDVVLEGKQKDFEKARNTKIDAIKESEGKLSLLAEDKKTVAEKDVEKLKSDLLEYDRQQKADLTKERNEKIREILLEIEKVVSDYAAAQNYSMILNDRVLIFGEKTLDVTEPILKKLNNDQSKK